MKKNKRNISKVDMKHIEAGFKHYANQLDEEILPIINESRKFASDTFGTFLESRKTDSVKAFGEMTVEVLNASFLYNIAGAKAFEIMTKKSKSEFYIELTTMLLRDTYFKVLEEKYGESNVSELANQYYDALKNALSNGIPVRF